MAGSDNAVLARGLFDGINNAVAIMRDDKSNRQKEERDNTLYQQKQNSYMQGQQDRESALKRRGITEGRADAKFDRNEKDRVRQQRSQEALNNFMVRGDLEGTNSFLDEYSPDGMKPNIVMRDGKYFSEGPDASGTVVSKPMEQRDIGKLLMRMGKQDVFGDFQKGLDAENAGKKLKGDRAHDISKIELKNKGALDVAKLRLQAAALSRKGKKGSGRGLGEGKIPEYSKQNAKLAANYYGGKFENGVFSFGSDGDELKAASATALADLMYKSKPKESQNINVQFREATMLVEKASAEADRIAKAEEESGALGDMAAKDRSAQIFESIMSQTIEKAAPAAQPAIKRSEQTGEKETKKLTEKEYFDSLRSNPKFKGRTDAQIKARVSDMAKKFPERFKIDNKQAGKGAQGDKTKDVAALNRDGYLKRKRKNKAVVA